MSVLSQFGGGSRATKSIVHGYATAGYTPLAGVGGLGGQVGAKQVVSGALTAGVLSTVLSISGSGQLNYLSLYSVDATARTHRLVLTIDGTVVYDYTSASTSTTNAGAVVVGTNSASPGTDQVEFKTSLLVQVASSVTETGKTGIDYRYKTY